MRFAAQQSTRQARDTRLPSCDATALLKLAMMTVICVAVQGSTHTSPVAANAGPPPGSAATTAKPGLRFTEVHQAGIFLLQGTAGDGQVLRDIAEVLQKHAPQVCRDLEYQYKSRITVEVYPDQASFDRAVMDPALRGYYACSGNRRIQMVSPRNPIAALDIPYAERARIAVHEFVHLVNNEINPRLPIWLNEGVACRIGPHAAYAYVAAHLFPFDRIPSFQDMERSYHSIPGADLFAYALLDFIVQEYGLAALNRLIRAPAAFESILGVSRNEFENLWRQYMHEHYKGR